MLQRISIASLVVTVSTLQKPNAILTLTIDGKTRSCQKGGRGGIDAVFDAINDLFPNTAVLEDYEVHLAHPGTDTNAKVKVTLSVMGRAATGVSENADTIIGSAKAYIEALNQHYS